MKRLAETFEAQVIMSDPNLAITVDNMCSEWGMVSYPQLSVLLVQLRFLSMIHQNHHWSAKGDPFYGDHLMFQRLYDAANAEVDAVAEKAVGLGSTSNVDMQLCATQLMRLVQGYGMVQLIPQPTELMKRSLMAELNFLMVTSLLVESLKENGIMTRGLDNMIAGIEDSHEGAVYLLKQRLTPGQ